MIGIFEKIRNIGIVPVVSLKDSESAVPLAKSLCGGDLPCVEITFRTAQAESSIRKIAEQMPEMLLGAGTVTTREQVDSAKNAGAQFIVTPGLNPNIVKYCLDAGVPVVPGCSGPSDIERVLELGLDTVKFFPAEQAGGINYIKAIAAPYTTVKFMPTGGVNASNLLKYLEFERVIACGGSWMASSDKIAAGKFEEITAECKKAVALLHGFKLAGVSLPVSDTLQNPAELLNNLFGQDGADRPMFDVCTAEMKVTVKTNDVSRAKAFLERRGAQFFDSRYSGAGVLVEVTMKEPMSGVLISLVR